MKTKLIAGVIATCFAAPVLAQSSVQIYGIADAGIVKTKGEKAKIVSGGADGSRLGFKGTEDIGGGFKAIFQLEARVELDTGTQTPALVTNNDGFYLRRGMEALGANINGGLATGLKATGETAVNREKALFDRTAMVGLVTPVGAILLGRMYTPGYEVFAAADTFENGTGGAWGGITGGTAGFSALGADIRSQKSIQYRIATPGGFGGSLMYGFKNSGYLGRYNKFYGAALTYKANGLDVGVAHNQGYDLADQKSLTTTTMGGSYTMGDFKFFAGYHDQKNLHSALLNDYFATYDTSIATQPNYLILDATTKATLRGIFVARITENTQIDANSAQIGMHYKIGAGRLMASVARQNDRTRSNSDATLAAIGYDYNLSKRTDVYATFAHISNQNDGQYTPGIAGAPGGFTKVKGDDSHSILIGMRHRF
ncbi:porin [Massilia sp. TSP1-1-2]|uniref:porin n=1 Tax=unclassified Massilia TaxID=2609279 RepID=UPI003CF0BE13